MHLSLSRHKPEDTELLTARNMSHRNGAVLTSPDAHISSSLRKNIWTKISLTYKGWWSTLSQRLINSLWTISSKHQSIVYWPPMQENWLIGELSAQNIDYAKWTLISMPTDTVAIHDTPLKLISNSNSVKMCPSTTTTSISESFSTFAKSKSVMGKQDVAMCDFKVYVGGQTMVNKLHEPLSSHTTYPIRPVWVRAEKASSSWWMLWENSSSVCLASVEITVVD